MLTWTHAIPGCGISCFLRSRTFPSIEFAFPAKAAQATFSGMTSTLLTFPRPSCGLQNRNIIKLGMRSIKTCHMFFIHFLALTLPQILTLFNLRTTASCIANGRYIHATQSFILFAFRAKVLPSMLAAISTNTFLAFSFWW